jgi:hypothetical protein
MNRRYDPPETQDHRRQIGTDQTAALAPEAAAPEIARRTAATITSARQGCPKGNSTTGLPPPYCRRRRGSSSSWTRAPSRESSKTRCVDCVTRRRALMTECRLTPNFRRRRRVCYFGTHQMDGNEEADSSPSSLERSVVPLQFPQFRNSGALAHLAHVGRGPRYVIVGGKAWYDPADIRAWLEARKQNGPAHARQLPERISARAVEGDQPKKRGRPTKLEQMSRRLGRFPYFER